MLQLRVRMRGPHNENSVLVICLVYYTSSYEVLRCCASDLQAAEIFLTLWCRCKHSRRSRWVRVYGGNCIDAYYLYLHDSSARPNRRSVIRLSRRQTSAGNYSPPAQLKQWSWRSSIRTRGVQANVITLTGQRHSPLASTCSTELQRRFLRREICHAIRHLRVHDLQYCSCVQTRQQAWSI